MTNVRHLVSGLIGLLTLSYPIAVYFGIQYFGIKTLEPWKIATTLLILILIRLIIIPSNQKWKYLLPLVGVIYCVLAVWHNTLMTLRFYPVLISVGLLTVFAGSLIFPPPIIERLAKLQHPNLPEQGIRYTRKVTQVWCVFFMLNSLIATATALWSSFAWWSLYNGFISYLLIGLLMTIEYVIRIKTQAHVR